MDAKEKLQELSQALMNEYRLERQIEIQRERIEILLSANRELKAERSRLLDILSEVRLLAGKGILG